MNQAQAEPKIRLSASQAYLIHTTHLGAREVEALELLSQFFSNKEIAFEMKVSLPVTKKLLRSAYAKLGVRCRAEAVFRWCNSDMAIGARGVTSL